MQLTVMKGSWSAFCRCGCSDMRVNHHDRSWSGPRDFRVICDCQRHRRSDGWRSAVDATKGVFARARKHGLAVIIGVPLALSAFELPTEAMNTNVSPAAVIRAMSVASSTQFPLLTPQVREQFLNPELHPRHFTIEVAKEEFFRTKVPYGSIIYREARRNNLAPELVAAVVSSESDFRARLVSNKSAQGLMQIMPETARLLGVRDAFDPDENITAGAKYLRYLLNRFGDQRVALAAYNAGEGNVERFGGIPPFPETQNYIERVSDRARQYRQRLRGHVMASLRVNTNELQ